MQFIDNRFLPCELREAKKLKEDGYDCVLLVLHDSSTFDQPSLKDFIAAYVSQDASASKAGANLLTGAPIPSGRVVLSHTGPITRDFDDVRRFEEAGRTGMLRAMDAGSKSPLVFVQSCPSFPRAELVGGLGALRAAYVPLELREIQKPAHKVSLIGFCTADSDLVRVLSGLEAGRCVARDVAGSDPERMAPPASAKYVTQAFANSNSAIKVSVTEGVEKIRKEFPLMGAVNRGSDDVPRHQARLIYLEYVGEGEIKETLMFVGKGVTLDTGGLDVKYDGAMWGMSRDKSGAAVVAGIFKTLDCLRPKNIKVMGYLSMVRNGIGPNSYSCDEIITSRAGKRIRIVNTDAEGRLAMLDPLCHMKEMAPKEVNPHLFTVATLTGHAVLTVGNYSIVMDNGPASNKGFAESLRKDSELIGDIVEISKLRREDFEFHRGESEYEDLRQSNTKASSQTERGHMTPAAFLIMGSGLDKHGADSNHPIPYSHVDMAGTDGPFPEAPQARPLLAFAQHYFL